MLILAVIALVLGTLYGLSGQEFAVLDYLASHTDYILYLTMVLVGISVGLHESIVEQMKKYHLKLLFIPTGIIIGSIIGGVICSFVLSEPMRESLAISGGLGWYSLTGVAIGNLSGAEYGSIAFLSNLMREIISFFVIPVIAIKLNYYTCIAPAGATSEDTTLPMMIRYTDEKTVVFSVLNGVICSAAVPVIMSACYTLF